MTPQDMSQHAQTCFNLLIAFFLTQIDKLLNTPRMCKVCHVDKYKITFKLVFNHWTNEILQHTVVSSGQHLGLSFSTHSRIFFVTEYFHYKTFVYENCLEN